VLKRPTAIRWSREESIIGHHKRHPFFITAKWGAKRDGTITAVETTLVADGGAYASTSIEVLKGAMIVRARTVRDPERERRRYAVLHEQRAERRVPRLRRPQAHFAAESMITRVAHALGLDPLDVRRKNLYREGSINSSGT
jgi:CO/xanthine dehydrogenase Mo-binding subunit